METSGFQRRPFMQVDVFTSVPFRGNPVAVILDAEGLDTAAMQSIARWTNLSETTFVLPARRDEADYRLRIFTPGGELPFAGHPTLGSAHAIIETGIREARDGVLVQECDAGLVRVERDPTDARLWLTVPPARIEPLAADAAATLERALGARLASPCRIDVGPVWITARLSGSDSVLDLAPDLGLIREISLQSSATGVTVFSPNTAASAPGQARYEVRSFAPVHGVDEDPVCGSGNGCVAAYLARSGSTQDYVARQGRAIQRDGWIGIRYGDDGAIRVGGHAVACIRGEIIA